MCAWACVYTLNVGSINLDLCFYLCLCYIYIDTDWWISHFRNKNSTPFFWGIYSFYFWFVFNLFLPSNRIEVPGLFKWFPLCFSHLQPLNCGLSSSLHSLHPSSFPTQLKHPRLHAAPQTCQGTPAWQFCVYCLAFAFSWDILLFLTRYHTTHYLTSVSLMSNGNSSMRFH